MSTQAPWLSLSVDWQDSGMFDDADPEIRLAWICLLCHAKTNGRAGVVKLREAAFCKRWQISKSATSSMLDRAKQDKAITFGADETVLITNWKKYQDPKRRSVESQASTTKGVAGKKGRISKTPKNHKNDATHHPSPITSKESSKENSLTGRKRNPFWDAVVAIFYSAGIPDSQLKVVGKLAADFKKLGATEDEIRLRLSRIREAWGDSRATARSVIAHWGQFAKPCEPKAGGDQFSFAKPQRREKPNAEGRGEYPEPDRPLPSL